MSDIFLAEGICKKCSKCTDPEERWDYRESLFNLISNVTTEIREQVDEWSTKFERLQQFLYLADHVRFECSNCCSADGNSEAWKLILESVKQPYAEAVAESKKETVASEKKKISGRKKSKKGKLIRVDFGASLKKEEIR